jgi:hypothetical protein
MAFERRLVDWLSLVPCLSLTRTLTRPSLAHTFFRFAAPFSTTRG